MGRNLRNHLVQFLHFRDKMTLYPILRGDVSQIIIHILENWNFGGVNSTESKKKKKKDSFQNLL